MYVSSNRPIARRLSRRPVRQGLGDTAGAAFEPAVEQWRDRVSAAADDLPVDFLLAWIKRESGGNVCSYTSYGESGIFQLMPGDNMNQGGTTEARLRPACSGQSMTRAFTSDELDEQVRSGIQYIKVMRDAARRKLAAAGVNWSEDSADFWRVVKLQHAYPGPTAAWLAGATAALGHPPATWAEMRSTISGYDSVLNNAEWVGGYGEGGGGVGSSVKFLILLGGLGALAAIMYRYSRH